MKYPTIKNHETMTSVDIAELTGKKHSHVMRDIRLVMSQLIDAGEDISGFIEEGYQDKQKKRRSRFGLTYSATMILISGYNPVIRSKIINRWQELERNQKPVALSYDEIVHQALTMADAKVKALTSQVSEMQPKADGFERLAVADGSLCITDAAKALQVQPKKVLFPWLQANRWIYRRAGGKNWIGYQEKVQQGLLEHKVSTQTQPDGTEKIREQVLITPKGLARIAQEIGNNESGVAGGNHHAQ